MRKRPFESSGLVQAALCLAALLVALCASPAAPGQAGPAPLPEVPVPAQPLKPLLLPDRIPEQPTQPPAFSISATALGYASPGPYYLGQRVTLLSLDFLDEDRILFTFRVPGLMRREPEGESGERQIRAVTVLLPSGTVSAEALWTVHDQARYLWMLRDGHFLLRDRNSLELGDATLELKPYLRFPGPLLWLDMDPEQGYLVADTRESAETPPPPGTTPNPPGASAEMVVEGQSQAGKPDYAVRILRRDTGKVMLISRVRSTVHLPINASGYLETLHAGSSQWLVNLNYFSGGSRVLGRVDSSCAPTLDFVSDREVLATGCRAGGGNSLVAITTDGRRLWEDQIAATAIWPNLVRSPDGSRLARETLSVPRALSARTPLDTDDIKGQMVQVLNAADGSVELATRVSPALDGGGNVAISPSGRRVAVLNAGAIQVFDLAPAAAREGPERAARP